MTDITDTELAELESQARGDLSETHDSTLALHAERVLALVAALRSEREDLQIANERGDAWRERVKEDTLRIEKLREKNDRQAYRLSQYQSEVETTRHNLTGCAAKLERKRTQYETRSRAYEECLDQLGAAQIELLRERTQNLALRSAFQEYVDATGPWMKSQADNINHPLTKAVNVARAALSTQEESK